MRRRSPDSMSIVVLLIAGMSVGWAVAGDLDPPAGPVSPTMKTLDELSSEHAALQASLSGVGISRVIHGSAHFNGGSEVTVALSPPIDPSKSVVLLERSLAAVSSAPITAGGRAVRVVSLASDSMTLAVEFGITSNHWCSYQIIEYN